MDITKKLLLPGTILLAAVLGTAGSVILSNITADAASSTSSGTSTSQQPATNANSDPSKGGHVGINGTKEVLLTGVTADKVKAAALAAVPGGTVLRVENDAEGSPYEAHMTKSDGTRVTVKVDSSFKVTSVDTDSNHGPNQGNQTQTQ